MNTGKNDRTTQYTFKDKGHCLVNWMGGNGRGDEMNFIVIFYYYDIIYNSYCMTIP
jgi:hypothetical protein